MPRLDAPLWYLVGIGAAARAGALDPAPFRDSVRAVVRMLDALEYNGKHLLYVPVGGDWADEWIYEGYILHEQVLRAWALRYVGAAYGESSWRTKAGDIEAAIERHFWPPDAIRRGYPLAAFTPTRTHDMFDLATISLLAVSGLAPTIADAALTSIAERSRPRPYSSLRGPTSFTPTMSTFAFSSRPRTSKPPNEGCSATATSMHRSSTASSRSSTRSSRSRRSAHRS